MMDKDTIAPNSGPHAPKLHVDEVELISQEVWDGIKAREHDGDKMEQVTTPDRGVELEDAHDYGSDFTEAAEAQHFAELEDQIEGD